MFARLKKRIQEEGGNVNDVDKTFITTGGGPGLASPVNKFQGSPFTSQSSQHGKEWPDTDSGLSSAASPNSQSSEDITSRENCSREEVVSLLHQKTDQCKKLELKINNIKGKKAVEKREASETKKENGLKQDLQRLEEENKKTISESIQEKTELRSQLEEVEKLKEKFYKQEEENDEFQGLATQELAKIKHLLLIAENELSKTQAYLEEKSQKLDESEKRTNELESQIAYLLEQVESLTVESNLLKEECKARAQAVETLTIDKSAFEKRVIELTYAVKQKSQHVSSLESSTAELENNHVTLQRNYDLCKTKMTKTIEEKNDLIVHLEERVSTLEQRLNDHGLSENDQIKALQSERDSLEKKLSESRQQLQEVKFTWSDKITHLEGQISHLNAKIIEDSEELSGSQQAANLEKINLHKQIEDLQMKLDDAEKRVSENWDLATQKDVLHEKEREQHELLLEEIKMKHSETEELLLNKIDSLESQVKTGLMTLEEVKFSADQTIAQMEENEEELSAKQLLLERKIQSLEEERNEIQNKLISQENEYSAVLSELQEKTSKLENVETKLEAVEKQLDAALEELQAVNIEASKTKADLQFCTEEKDRLLLRNAELFQQLQSLQQSQQVEKMEYEQVLKEKSEIYTALKKEVEDNEVTLDQYRKQIAKLEAQIQDGAELSSELILTRNNLRQLEETLNDKNKTLKSQQQKLIDLRKTLQKELKVQALPNDNLPPDNRDSSNTPPLKRKNNLEQSVNISSSLNKLPHEAYAKSLELNHMRTHSDLPVHATDSFRVKADEKDVNFLYLKHVVLKFMLSRENEALQLIRAVSVLLKFTQDEQQMIRDTLEYKMSWFGSRPSLGRGQTAKIIPPSF
ncbi:golgin subfamily A member 1 isoform X2 [Octopus sinensis]|uniref:Golgin subfamily A member 1 n=1 Tax=Octopus sinensis TaxID=2607531 RepID=A0A6P7SRM5_9MOLL|nr:golgin subfamily A member 1 isoform X2 [Octopus sinensis]